MSLEGESLERIHDLETEVALLRKDTDIQTRTLDKLESSADRLLIMVEALNRQVTAHEVQFRAQDKQNNNTDTLIAERREEAHEDNERIIESLREFKADIIARLDDVKDDVKEKPTETKFEFVKTIVENWKYILFAVAFGGGIVTHKWGFFTNLFN